MVLTVYKHKEKGAAALETRVNLVQTVSLFCLIFNSNFLIISIFLEQKVKIVLVRLSANNMLTLNF